MPCTYHSITIPPGGSFILPPNSSVVACSEPTSLTAENDCVDLNNLEEAKCWLFQWEMEGPDDQRYDAWENAILVKLVVGDQEYPLSSNAYLTAGSNQLKDLINNSIPALTMGGTAAYGDTYDGDNSDDYRHVFWCKFYTTPSIAATCFLHIVTDSATHNGTYVIIPARDECSGYVD